MERKTPLRAGGPALRTHPLGGCRWRGWLGTGYQTSLQVHPSPGSRCADRLPLRLRLRGCGCGLGDFFWLAGFCVLIFSMRKGCRPPGAIFFLHRRRKNMERKTPRRAGGTPPYEPTPLGGCRWCGWLCFDYQADLRVHPCPDSRCAGRSPLRCCLRTAVVA